MFLIHTAPEHAHTVARAVVAACKGEGWCVELQPKLLHTPFNEFLGEDFDFERWCPKAGIDRVIVKDFRRTFCSWMFNAGVPELATIRLMGHGSSEMVRRVYAQLEDATFENAIERLEASRPRPDNVVSIDRDNNVTANATTPRKARDKTR
jgi:hypothetical protein